ncbi:hypothetical protein [Nocardioides salsibiostraticola]
MGPFSQIPDLPRHPTLRPGSRVVRRDDHHLQVGVDPPNCAVLPDVTEVRWLLRNLRDGHPPAPQGKLAIAALLDLIRADLVVAQHPSRIGAAQFGSTIGTRLERRRLASVAVWADPACAAWSDEVTAAVREQGLAVVDPPTPAEVTIVLANGETHRDRVDDLVRAGAAHLLVVSRASGVEIGPFVDPGRTACHRCVDAHRAANDPRRGLVLEQVCQQIEEFADEPMDPLLLHWATAWVVRDVSRRVEGDLPSSWSTSYVVGPSAPPQATAWTRHPHCGCSWAADFDLVGG